MNYGKSHPLYYARYVWNNLGVGTKNSTSLDFFVVVVIILKHSARIMTIRVVSRRIG